MRNWTPCTPAAQGCRIQDAVCLRRSRSDWRRSRAAFSLAHILPLVYAAAALFVKSLPLSYPGMLALLTAGLLLAYWLDAASDSSPSLMGNIFLLLLSSLVFLLLTVIRFGGDFSSLGRREIYEALLKGPACFLAAMVAGWGFGRVAGRRLENTILKAKGKRSGKEK